MMKRQKELCVLEGFCERESVAHKAIETVRGNRGASRETAVLSDAPQKFPCRVVESNKTRKGKEAPVSGPAVRHRGKKKVEAVCSFSRDR